MLKPFATTVIVLSFFIPVSVATAQQYTPIPVSCLDDTKQTNQSINNKPSSTSLLFSGDIMLARNVEILMKDHGPAYPFSEVVELTKTPDYTIGNFEGSVPVNHVFTPFMNLRFSVDKSFLERLRLAGFDYLSLANNHSHDYGLEGFLNTKQELQANDLITFGGTGELTEDSVSYLSLKDGRRLALVGISALDRNYTELELEELFGVVAKESDIQIVYIHWGNEYQLIHAKSQEKLAHLLVEVGADAIVGHHPHVVQDIGVYQGVPIFYSLGNLVFDQYFSESVQEGLLLKLTLTKAKASYQLIPVSSLGSRSLPRQMAPDESSVLLKELAKRSDPALADQIRGGLLIEFSSPQ